ncbi:MAG: FMN-dependent NADH-azoreductase [Rhodospirillaceae bacterium]|jgi:FMN-dependent NADH-azoreductase|nr:FMN-dependent NADH-azoreductase [Rhodospirillaceae bacterium]
MKSILAVTSSPKSEGSVSNALVDRFTQNWSDITVNAEITRRDVGANPLPHLDEATIGAIYTPDDARSDAQRDLLALSDAVVEELEAADVIVIGAPMHNFAITSALKTWIDHAARVGRTFRYTAEGPEGQLKGKKVFVLTARGGNYGEGSPAQAMDHQTPYLKTVLGFLGLTDVTFIHAEGVAQGHDGIDAAVQMIAAAMPADLAA